MKKEEKKFYNVRDIIDNAINKYSNNVAFKIKEKKGKEVKYKEITYKKMQSDIYALGTAINSITKNEKRVAVIGKNSYPWMLTYLSTLYGNNIIVPLDKGLPALEIKDLIKRSKANIVVFEDEYMDTMKEIKSENKIVEQFICMQRNDEFKDLDAVISEGRKEFKKGNKKIMSTKIDDKKLATIIFTSGTTSISKGVMLSQYNIASNINSLQHVITIYDNDVNMAFLPFHHTFGSTGLILFLSKGACNTFCDGLRHIQSNLVEYKVSIFVCVPLLLEAMYKKIMQEVKKQNKEKTVKFGVALSKFLLKFKIDIRRKIFKDIINKLGGNLRYIVSGASAIDRKVAEGFNNFGMIIVQGYGLTETSPVVGVENDKYHRIGSIGKAVPSIEVKIVDKNEEGIGELIVKGPNVMLGYYNNEEANKEVLKDGWFYTGDLAKIDEEGYIYICGRKKSVIVLKNGKNIFPEEMENLVNKIEGVKESFIFGKQQSEDKDDIKINVKIVFDREVVKEVYKVKTDDEIYKVLSKKIKEINKTMPTYKAIRGVLITEKELIKTTTNKIKRQANLDAIEKFSLIKK